MAYVVTLTTSDLEFGKHLVKALEEKRFPFSGVLWIYEEQADDWKLIIATDLVDKKGSRDTYLQLSSVTAKIPASDFQLMRLTVVSPKIPLYQALRSVFGTGKSVEGARLTQTVVSNILISDAYLYVVR